jgi:plastocyanin
MLNRMRTELAILVTLAIAVTALVLALRDDSSPPAEARPQASGAGVTARLAKGVAEGTKVVEIVNFVYDPDPIRVAAGEPVAWRNRDGAPHTATARDGSWDSGTLAAGEIALIGFDEPGVYSYICTLHPPASAAIFGASDGTLLAGGGRGGMQGTIIVE